MSGAATARTPRRRKAAEPVLPLPAGRPPRFLAIDFETADYARHSACSVGLVLVEGERVLAREHRLIRPAGCRFVFSYIHGITAEDVADQPVFGELWPELAPFFEGADFLVAHNASFDRGVLAACCERHGLPLIGTPFVCTLRLARRLWGLKPAKLPDVCRHLSLPLRHHNALSDAEACAAIIARILRDQGTAGLA